MCLLGESSLQPFIELDDIFETKSTATDSAIECFFLNDCVEADRRLCYIKVRVTENKPSPQTKSYKQSVRTWQPVEGQRNLEIGYKVASKPFLNKPCNSQFVNIFSNEGPYSDFIFPLIAFFILNIDPFFWISHPILQVRRI